MVCCGYSYFPPKEWLFVVNFMPFTQGFDWFLFVTKYNPPGPSQGSTHGEANDKLIMAVRAFEMSAFPVGITRYSY